MQTSNKKVVGLSGVARSGKDTFASILTYKLQQAGKSVKRIALADPLKSDVNDFLMKNLGISAFTTIPEEKLIIRPMLVWYGDAQRKRTNGRYWIDIAKKTIDETNYDYYIITDIRYDVYEKDELYFLKNEVNGILCHISKFIMLGNPFQPDHKLFVQPANDHEADNDPKINAAAHHIIKWEHVECKLPEDLLLDPQLNTHVDKFMNIWLQNF
jgi:hypothetical protein